MEITGAERQIDDICDSRNKNGGTFIKQPGLGGGLTPPVDADDFPSGGRKFWSGG